MNVPSLPGQHFELSVTEQADRLAHLSEKEQIGHLAKQFEAIFLRHFLGDTLEPAFGKMLGQENAASGIYQYFLVDSFASSLSQGNALGLASSLQAQLLAQLPSESDPTDGPEH